MGVVLATRPNSTRANASGRRSCLWIFGRYSTRSWRLCRRNLAVNREPSALTKISIFIINLR
jgi:hypothetical protein